MYAKKLNVCMHELNSIENKQWQALELKDPLFIHQILSNKCAAFCFQSLFHGIKQLTSYCCL